MPSNAILEQKIQFVADYAEILKQSKVGVIVSYKGITVAADTKLRKELREAGVDYRVVKNTLLRRAAEKAGIEGLDPALEGTTAVAVDSDYTNAARILAEFADKSKTGFEVKLGYMDGKVISAAEVNKLAKLPGRDVLLATIAGTCNSIIASFARAVQAVADAKSDGTAAPAAEEAPAAE
ncbi:MAG: 50S ribosomal protein L10 [Oscillospiraceae bacterium]|jgi:large subunit ribosomal protein L10|nr:50S ribosomal protein L10 [Oscillospiraceae bacterium]